MRLTILGNNSAIPSHGRNPSAQVVEVKDQLLLLDCGEGTQMQLIKYGIKRSKIHHIFISHLHGDHYFGLIGLITSFALLGRTDPLHVYGPAQLGQIINVQLDACHAQLPFPLHFFSLSDAGERTRLIETASFSVTSFPVEHRIPTHGFLIRAKNPRRKINPDACSQYEIPRNFYKHLQAGMDFRSESGAIISNELLTFEGNKDKTYAYCADTRYTLSFLNDVLEADVLYHESTYLDAEVDLANMRYHATARQAAELALQAGARQLVLGHYSSRYKDIALFENEARQIFPHSIASYEGMVIDI